MPAMTYLVTGGAGFIGSAVARLLVQSGETVVVVDKLTYAADLRTLDAVRQTPRFFFEKVDICNGRALTEIFSRFSPSVVLHLAAESHVDRSIDGPSPFIMSNVVGTYELLHRALAYWETLAPPARDEFRFVHVSTDEVYGELGHDGSFSETSPYRPNSPYSASKAAADHLSRAWHRTYGLPVIVTNCSNNYGPYQFPEKLIPTAIGAAIRGDPIPVYGRGENIRDWIYVEDHARALALLARRSRSGDTYNIGAGSERRNIDLVREICALLDMHAPRRDGRSYCDQIAFVKDRPGHDFRYAIDANKICSELGWQPRESFASGLEKTVLWYLRNREWLHRKAEPAEVCS